MPIKFRLVQKSQAARMAGITLLELMIVVVIVGILASLAFPSYQEQVRKTKRADGKSVLLNTSQRLERCYTRFANYTIGPGSPDSCPVAFPVNSPDGHYAVTTAAMNPSAYTLAAAPQGPQVDDTKCATLSLTSTGVQGSTGTDPNSCW